MDFQSGSSDVALAMADVNAAIATEARLGSETDWKAVTQGSLSDLIDTKTRDDIKQRLNCMGHVKLYKQ